MKPNKTPFGFLIMGALIGAVLGGATSDLEHHLYATVVGSILGVVGVFLAELAYVNKLTRIEIILIIAILLILMVLLGWQPTPPR